MNNSLILRAIILFGGLSSFSALAVESPKPVIPLFNEYLATNVAGIDATSDTGIEAVAVNQLIKPHITSNPNKLQSLVKVKLRAQNTATHTLAAAYIASVQTKRYPDPDTAVNTNYACEDDGYIVAVDPTSEDYPCDYDLNVGIANVGATRYAVMGLAVYAWYSNIADGEVDISRASVTVRNPDNGHFVCRGEWDVQDHNWYLEDALSAVGDFLSGDGVDEIRIVYSQELVDGTVEMKYTYYDITTCNPIDEDTFSIGVP